MANNHIPIRSVRRDEARPGATPQSPAAGKEAPSASQRIAIRSVRRFHEDRPDTTLVSAAMACANCALKDGPACGDCVDHALRGYGFVHRTPIVRH